MKHEHSSHATTISPTTKQLPTPSKMGKWSEYESNRLREAINLMGDKHWTDVSKWLKQHNIHRLPTQCRHRWHKTMIPNLKKGHWQQNENDLLRQAVVEQQHDLVEGGTIDWESVSRRVPGRTGKACRERWISRLDPNINRNPFSEEEEHQLVVLHERYRNKWAQIAKHMPGRTADAVKSKYISIKRRISKNGSVAFPSVMPTPTPIVLETVLQSPLRKRKQDNSEQQHSQSPPKRRQSPIAGSPSFSDSMDTDMVCNTLNTLEVEDTDFCLPHNIHTSNITPTIQRKPAHSLDLGEDIWDQYAHVISPCNATNSSSTANRAGKSIKVTKPTAISITPVPTPSQQPPQMQKMQLPQLLEPRTSASSMSFLTMLRGEQDLFLSDDFQTVHDTESDAVSMRP